MCVMLAERSVAILLEDKYAKLMKHYMFALYVTAAWFLAFLCAVIPPALGFYSEVSPGKGTCFPPINTYAIITFYIIYLIGKIPIWDDQSGTASTCHYCSTFTQPLLHDRYYTTAITRPLLHDRYYTTAITRPLLHD